MIILLVYFIFLPASLFAAPMYNGQDLLNDCQQALNFLDDDVKTDEFKAGICYGYIQAIMTEATNYGEACPKNTKAIAPTIKMIVDFLKENSNVRNNGSGREIVNAVVKKLFPCN